MFNTLKGWFTKGANSVSSGVQKTAFSTKVVLITIKNKAFGLPADYKRPEMTWNEQNELVVTNEEPKKKKKGRPSKKDSDKEAAKSKPVESKAKEEPKK